MKLQIVKTPHDTIRVWMYFEPKDKVEMQKTREYQLFQALAIWGGHDRNHKDHYSWELHKSSSEFLKYRFQNYENCEINL